MAAMRLKWIALAASFTLVALAGVGRSGEAKEKGFDAKSPKATLDWVVTLWKPSLEARDDDGNELAAKAKQKRLTTAVASLVDKEIDWTMAVGRVDAQGISLRPLSMRTQTVPRDGIGLPRGIYDFNLSVAAPKDTEKKPERRKGPQIGGGTVKEKETYTRPFPVLTEAWVLKLKTGAPVRLQGKIADAKCASGQNGYTVGLIVSDFKLSPVSKKSAPDSDREHE
jgi:hypothetical protein